MTKVTIFTWQQAMSCIFPIVLFITLALTKFIRIPFVPRYDFILIIAIFTQLVLYWSGIETLDEVKVIFGFHIIGFVLEVFKVHTGSWAYPGYAWSKLFGVPLYSGFMYSSVASYMCQVWRRLDLTIIHWPTQILTIPLGALIYLNFFTDHFIYDIRWLLIIFIIAIFWRTTVQYRLQKTTLHMQLILSFLFIGLFIWAAENIATYFEAWQYPYQKTGWHMVSYGKISSWTLLVIVSFMIVAQLKHVKQRNGLLQSIGNEKTTTDIPR